MTTDAELFDALKYRVDISPITGTRRYYNSANQLHRDEGPAVIYTNGIVSWWQDGQLHRIDGPAVERGSQGRWFLFGVEYTEDNYSTHIQQLEVTTCRA
jgi:hypothetical protein